MPIANKIEPKDFYENLPSSTNETGDIWLSLPSWGIAGLNKCAGVVITPACDLSQKKTEAVLILPIISIVDYFFSKSFFFDIWNEYGSKIKNAGFEINPSTRFDNPSVSDLNLMLQEIVREKKHATLCEQVKEYINYINYTELEYGERIKHQLPNIEVLLGKKKYDDIIKKMITNSYKSDVHFFPAYYNAGDYSAVPKHSLALFRYAYSVPVEIFDAAQTSSDSLWQDDRILLTKSYPIAREFNSWPLKASRLKDDFLSDLISRYLSMFMRLGSRDFTSHTVGTFITEIKGVE